MLPIDINDRDQRVNTSESSGGIVSDGIVHELDNTSPWEITLGEATSDKFQLQLLGGFALRDPKGKLVDIPSKKARALLALLAIAENGERTRSWLQDHLWSRGSSQDSLRKELSSLRTLLGSFDLDPLPKDVPRDMVRLNLACFDIDVRSRAIKSKGEFLEGLDITHEHNFEEWLRETRAYFDSIVPDPLEVTHSSPEIARHTSPSRVCVGISPMIWDTANHVNDAKKVILSDSLDRVVKSLLSSGGIELFDHRFSSPVPNVLNASASKNPQVLLLPRVTETSNQLVLTVELILNETNQVICAHRNEFELNKLDLLLEDPSLMTPLVAETVDEILFALYRRGPEMMPEDECSVLKLTNEAIAGMFGLSFTGLDRARLSLDKAIETLPESVIYAWRAYLSAHQIDDPRVVDLKQIQKEARYYSRRAIELDRYNPLTLSLLTHVYAFTLREFDIASDYIQQAKALGSDHIMTYDSDALLNLYLGQLPQSKTSALQAIQLSRFLPFKYMFITSLCMIDARAGDYESAIAAGEKSLRLQPATSDRPYPPTIRYLAESYARYGKKDKALELVNNLNNANRGCSVNDRTAPTLQIGEFLKISQSKAG